MKKKLSTLNSPRQTWLGQLSTPQRGQTLLIVVLVMVVSLTIGLSVASRSIVNLRIATEEENSQRAFSAAEAGIEQLIKSSAGNTISIQGQRLSNNATIESATTTQISGSEFLLDNGNIIAKDDGADVWLVEHNADGTLNYNSGWHANSFNGVAKLTVYWGSVSDACTEAAIEIIVVSGNTNTPTYAPKTERYAIDPCTARRGYNKFSTDDIVGGRGGIVAGKSFSFRTIIDIQNSQKGIVVRIIPLYASTPIAVKGCGFNDTNCNLLPSQGKKVDSVGASGGTERKITYVQGYPKLPPEFFYVLFEPGAPVN